MNMRALVLHVLGDALGNVGVIATGLVIWLTSWSFKYYFDPVISLVITVIIFSSALPLGKSSFLITRFQLTDARRSPKRLLHPSPRCTLHYFRRTSPSIYPRRRRRPLLARVTHLATLRV